MLRGALAKGARVVASWRPEERDAVLYSASSLFALVTAQVSSISLYQQWGRLAAGPYAAGAIASAILARRARRREEQARAGVVVPGASEITGHNGAMEEPRPSVALAPATPYGDGAGTTWHWTTARTVIFLVVLVGATLMPLSLEVLWRSSSTGTAHVQPEVIVVEHAGQRLYHREDPYQLIGGKHKVYVPPGQPAYDAYNPYLPLMSVFGLARSTDASPRLTDARVVFSIMTILLVVAALALCRGPTGPRVLALQSMTVLPTAALPLATGGDDLPVAALMLLGLVLLQRRRPLVAGIVLGVAASMKITAWPLAALAVFVATERHGDDRDNKRRARLWLLLGLGGVMIPAILPTAAENFPAFIENVVRFPLGLAGVASPAASPLLGHLVVTSFPGVHRAFTVSVAIAGALALTFVLIRHTPKTAGDLSLLVAWVMTVAILLAPATRIGYLLYPVNFFAWAWLLRSEDGIDRASSQDALSGDILVSARHRDRALVADRAGGKDPWDDAASEMVEGQATDAVLLSAAARSSVVTSHDEEP